MSTSGINVAIIGAGLVGASVLKQLLTVEALSNLHPVLIQNSKKSLQLDPSSQSSRLDISTDDWNEKLQSSSTAAIPLDNLSSFLSKLSTQSNRHTVVVDNTSNDQVASLYPQFLKAGLSVVTPNKKAYSAPLDLYKQILEATKITQSNPKPPLIYLESTVGAGLPIVGTLLDLVRTGDKIQKIEGVLSGTLSYIFNQFSTGKEGTPKFSEVVKVAKENGYTEPHPDADLSGSDVARKLTILSRLIPSLQDKLPQGFQSVPTKSLTPEPLQKVEDIQEYMSRLPEFDQDFETLNSEARKSGKALRYVGVIDVEKGEVKASLESYPLSHPFVTSLSGSDNIISFTTERYPKAPLLVQGSGAGADVTAMGVVADLIRVAERRG